MKLPSFWPVREGRDRQINKIKGFDPSVPEGIIFSGLVLDKRVAGHYGIESGSINTKSFMGGTICREI